MISISTYYFSIKKIIAFSSLLFAFSMIDAQDLVADNMLMFQRNYGGWPKHYKEEKINYNRVYSELEKATIVDESNRNDATIDNDATTKEIRYLLKTYQSTNNKKYLEAAERGIEYVLKAQYKNGGWPQFYPDLSSYRHEITYNDNAMTNVMNLLYDIIHHNNEMALVNARFIPKADDAVKRGIECILKTQIKVNGHLTAWCAQYDEVNYEPAKARSYELPSLSGNESVGIVLFLMRLQNPTPEIKNAIKSAVAWFDKVRIVGYKYVDAPDAKFPKGYDRVLVKDSNSTVWARFYEIENNEPFFCGRDGIKKKNVADIEYERRTGYGWYGTWPKDLLEKEYAEWLAKNK